MSNYRNKNTGIVISESEYYTMDRSERLNYRQISTSTNSSNNRGSGDFLTSAVIGAATGSALLGGLLGGDMLGGIAGDMFDGDLMD